MTLCSPQTRMFATEILACLEARRQMGPLTDMEPTFGPEAAQKVSHEITRRRVARGENPIGRKIGFTNRTIWNEYGVHQPIWGPVYTTTFSDVTAGAEGRIGHLVEPRIEPEIIFGFSDAIEPGMDERAILNRIGWVAHGFEIVQSLFPGWRFQAADCIAAFGLHGHLFCGPRIAVEGDRAALHEALMRFSITLFRDGVEIDRGLATNVLDGPVSAIRHLAGVLAHDPEATPIGAGEIITTGTVTRAFPVAPGERWTTRVDGLGVAGMDLHFTA